MTPGRRARGKPDTAEILTTVIFGIALAIGLGAAFVGLSLTGLWQDELYTGWIVDPAIGWGGMTSRALRDVSPPLYYVLLWPAVQLLGDNELGLRLFSALCAVAAILLFVLGGRPFFSLRARLFAAAMATASSYWFVQAQNARFYALGLLLSTVLLLLGLASMVRSHAHRIMAGLVVTTAVATFVHFYLFYTSIAVLLVIALYRPGLRRASLFSAIALVLAAVTYVKFVITRFSYALTGPNWIGNDLSWYGVQLGEALQQSLTHKAMLAVVLCLLPGALALARGERSDRTDSGAIVLCIAVPVLVLAAGLASSILVTPSFLTRYLLVCSPFLWGLAAFAYDRSVPPAPIRLRRLADLSLGVVLLWMAVTMAANRAKPYGEPFREAAAKIATMEACRGQLVPAVIMERRAWFRSPDAEEPIRAAYARYIGSFAPVEVVYLEDILAGKIPDAWKRMLQQRVDGEGCPVLAWTVHTATRPIADEIGRAILAAADRTSRASALETVVVSAGTEGYVLAMKR